MTLRGFSLNAMIVSLVILFAVSAMLLFSYPFVIPLLQGRKAGPECAFTLLLMVVIHLAWIYLEANGFLARYEIRINLDDRTIAAYDRWRREKLWGAPFRPDHLYITQTYITPIYLRGMGYPSCALAYGSSRMDYIEYGIPARQSTMLTDGSRWALEELMGKLAESVWTR